MMTVGEWLKRDGREFPKPGPDGCITGEQYDAAHLPMVVSCFNCTMTMVLYEGRKCDEEGRIFCNTCAGEDDHA
jgi:hypothetical protein